MSNEDDSNAGDRSVVAGDLRVTDCDGHPRAINNETYELDTIAGNAGNDLLSYVPGESDQIYIGPATGTMARFARITRKPVGARRNRTLPRKRHGTPEPSAKHQASIVAQLRAETANLLDGVELPERPRTRGDCAGHEGPCPWVSCRHHLYLDVNPETGSIKLNFPNLEPDELEHSCALDVADAGGVILEEVAGVLNVTRERARQIETMALGSFAPTARRRLR